MSYKNKKLYQCLRKWVYLLTMHPLELKRERKRKNKKVIEKNGLTKFKNIHKGERCFIIATGPSLTEADYLKLKNEVTIGVNGLCLWFEHEKKETTYFVISDEDVFKRVNGALERTNNTEIFVSERVKKANIVSARYHVFPVDLWNRFVMKEKNKRFSNDISICSYDEETVVFHAMQLAVYMGIEEIYLLGTDCNYNQEKVYAVDHGKLADKNLGNKMLSSYNVVKNFEREYGFRVFNVTRGGSLEVFERKNLDEVLEEKR